MENTDHLIFIPRLAQLYKLPYRKIIIHFSSICEQHVDNLYLNIVNDDVIDAFLDIVK